MKRIILAVAFLLVAAVPAFAVNRTVLLVDDVIRMTKAGVGDGEIIAFVKKSDVAFEVTGDDVIAMNDAHVSPAVMKFVIDESTARMKDARRDTSIRERVVVTRPYPYYYDPFYYGYGYGYGWYDPFWYGPRVSIGFGFGPRFGYGFRGGHFRHH